MAHKRFPSPSVLLRLLTAATPATAKLLYAASYSGTISTLDLDESGGTLDILSSTDGCAPSPAWVTLDSENGIIYCNDEGLTTTHGSMSSFSTDDEGKLTLLDKVDTLHGPVSSVVYGKDRAGLAVALYAGASIMSFDISEPGTLKEQDIKTFTLAEKGPNIWRQDAPHPHQANLDPTGAFVIAPDLGSDLLHVFKVGEDGVALTFEHSFKTAPGSGPRHVDFLEREGDKTVMYLISELANSITAYELVYDDDTLDFEELFVIPTYGEGNEVPEGASAAEILLSPDKRFLTISSRNEASFKIPNPDPNNCTSIPSDSLISFSVDATTGKLDLLQKFPSGGRNPRQFAFNSDGTLAAVGLQDDGRVVTIARDVETGEFSEIVAHADIPGVTCVIFNE